VIKDNVRLGKGLEALIPRTTLSAGRTILSLPITAIVPNPFQPRRLFDDDSMSSLVASIKKHGLNQPILVRRSGDGYELIAGERRLRACQIVGLEQIPSIIKTVSDEESLQLALIENIERQDLNSIEVARAYQRLVDEFEYTHQAIADAFGRSRSAVSNTMRLLNLPAIVQDDVASGVISEGHARTLLSLGTEEEMLDYVDRIKRGKLNVRQVEHAVSAKRGQPNLENQLLLFGELETQISRNFSKKVEIRGRKSSGKITFIYNSEVEFNELISRLTS